jgi:hypothetical protein
VVLMPRISSAPSSSTVPSVSEKDSRKWLGSEGLAPDVISSVTSVPSSAGMEIHSVSAPRKAVKKGKLR